MGIDCLSYENKFLSRLLQYLIGMTFFLSAAAKLADFQNTFQYFFTLFDISYSLMKTVLVLIITVEFALFLLIIFPTPFLQYAYILAITLLMVFILLSLWFIQRGIANCGCFGTSLPVKPLPTIVKNSVLIGILLFLYQLRKRQYDGF